MNENSNSNVDEVHVDDAVKDVSKINDCESVKLFVKDKKDCKNNELEHCNKN